MLMNCSNLSSWWIHVITAIFWSTGLLFALLVWRRSPINHSGTNEGNESSGKVLFIIDGCNGPIRLDRDVMLKIGDAAQLSKSVSFLRVVNGDSRKDRIYLANALERLMASTRWLGQVDIYFDGLGVDKYSKYGLEGQSLELRCHICLKVTPVHEEADNIIIQEVSGRAQWSAGDVLISGRKRLETFKTFDQLCRNGNDGTKLRCQALTFQRNGQGPGKSRNLLKPFGLLRPESFFCLFSFMNLEQNMSDARTISVIRHLLVDSTVQQSFQEAEVQQGQTIVATDDIFLRQRVVQAGGLVMTFEQLWKLLAPFATGSLH